MAWSEELHPRDVKGRFLSGAVGLKEWARHHGRGEGGKATRLSKVTLKAWVQSGRDDVQRARDKGLARLAHKKAQLGVTAEHVQRVIVRSDADEKVARAALAGIKDPRALAALKRNPLQSLDVVSSDGSGRNGSYSVKALKGDPPKITSTRVVVNGDRAPHTFGLPMKAGKSFSISTSAKTAEEAIRRTIVHEMGHHLHLTGGKEVDAIVRKAAGVHSIVERKEGVAAEKLAKGPNAVRAGAITQYAAKNHREYFAECFAAHSFEREALKAHDPAGFRMVEDVLDRIGRKAA